MLCNVNRQTVFFCSDEHASLVVVRAQNMIRIDVRQDVSIRVSRGGPVRTMAFLQTLPSP